MQKLAATVAASIILGTGWWAPDAFSPADAPADEEAPPPAGDERDAPDDGDHGSAPDPEPGTPDDDGGACDPGSAEALFARLGPPFEATTSWRPRSAPASSGCACTPRSRGSAPSSRG